MNFPYTYEKAHYNPLGQFINMCSYEKEEFIKKANEGVNFHSLKYFSVYFHELRHWLDHIGTIWGQNYLIEIYRRFDGILKGKTKKVSILSPFQIHEVLSSSNLNQVFKHHSSKRNSEIWCMNFRSELLNRVPFFVINFSDKSKQKICKSPVTFLSLFETNSISEEVGLFFYVLQSFEDEDQKFTEKIREANYYFEIAYNSEFIEYSAATHIPAGLLKIPNPLFAYRISSTINTIVLNLTSRIIKEISQNSELRKLNRYHSTLTENRDLGYLVYCLTKNYKNKRSSDRFSRDEFLELNQLPNPNQFEEEVLKEMENHKRQLPSSNIFKNRFNQQIEQGKEIIKLKGIDGKKISVYRFNQEQKIKPAMIFADDYWESESYPDFRKKNVDDFNFPEWYNLIEDLTKRDETLREKYF